MSERPVFTVYRPRVHHGRSFVVFEDHGHEREVPSLAMMRMGDRFELSRDGVAMPMDMARG